MKRLNKEYDVVLTKNFNSKIGTVNRLEPIVIYLNCRTWIYPKKDSCIKQDINFILINFKKKIMSILSNSGYFEKNIIIDFDVNIELIELNKKNFISFEIYLKQKNRILSLKELSVILENLLYDEFNNLIEKGKESDIFFYKNKNTN